MDVLCVQELGPALAGALSRVLPGGRLGPDGIQRGLGIACRHEAEVRTVALPRRDAWVARLTPGSWSQIREPIEIVNVHIMGPHTWPYPPRRHTRRGQLQGLLDLLDAEPHTPRALLGDLNASPAWPLYRRLSARLADAVEASGAGGLATWPHLPRLGLRGLIRIDHCLVSRLTAERARALPVPGSDHLGLCVDLRP